MTRWNYTKVFHVRKQSLGNSVAFFVWSCVNHFDRI